MENENGKSEQIKGFLNEAFDRQTMIQGVRMVAMTAALFGTMLALGAIFGGNKQA